MKKDDLARTILSLRQERFPELSEELVLEIIRIETEWLNNRPEASRRVQLVIAESLKRAAI